jgi:acyl-CoA-dependent ceramide synthase
MEKFPLLSTSTVDTLGPLNGSSDKSREPRTRRRSSGLGGEIRAGDTSGPALATLDVRPETPLVSQVGVVFLSLEKID